MNDDSIKRYDAIEVVYKALKTPPLKGVLTDTMSLAIALVQDIPSADRPQGEWIADEDGNKKCSNCGVYAPLSFDDYYMRGGKIRQEEDLLLCPYCGAKMKGAE